MITNFNEHSGNKYWLVATDERFVPSLKKIGCDKAFIDYQRDNENIFQNKYVYVGIGNRVSNYDWSWAGYSEEGKKAFEDLKYKYIGTVNIEEYEFKMDKYNL